MISRCSIWKTLQRKKKKKRPPREKRQLKEKEMKLLLRARRPLKSQPLETFRKKKHLQRVRKPLKEKRLPREKRELKKVLRRKRPLSLFTLPTSALSSGLTLPIGILKPFSGLPSISLRMTSAPSDRSLLSHSTPVLLTELPQPSSCLRELEPS